MKRLHFLPEPYILSGAPAGRVNRNPARLVGIGVALKTTTMQKEVKQCRMCGIEIPAERLEVIPDTLVCVRCSQKIGGEFELEVRMGGTGKVGSLKKTGIDVSVKRQRRRLI